MKLTTHLQVKNEWSYASTPPIRLQGANRTNFCFPSFFLVINKWKRFPRFSALMEFEAFSSSPYKRSVLCFPETEVRIKTLNAKWHVTHSADNTPYRSIDVNWHTSWIWAQQANGYVSVLSVKIAVTEPEVYVTTERKEIQITALKLSVKVAVSRLQYLATVSQRGGLPSISGQSLWDLWSTKWHWDRYFSPRIQVYSCQYHSISTPCISPIYHQHLS